MSKVTIAGDVNGTGVFTIAAPNGNTNRTLTLPDATGTVLSTATPGVPIGGPAFSAYANVDQSLTSGVTTKILFGSEIFDTNGDFASSRFTPTVAGYYQLNSTVRTAGTSVTLFAWYFFKNGVTYSTPVQTPTSTSASQSIAGSDLIYMNGATDYVEIYATVVGTSPIMNWSSDNITSTFSGTLIRSAT